MAATHYHTTWKFPKAFWIANIVELFEKSVYYAVFIAITLYYRVKITFFTAGVVFPMFIEYVLIDTITNQ